MKNKHPVGSEFHNFFWKLYFRNFILVILIVTIAFLTIQSSLIQLTKASYQSVIAASFDSFYHWIWQSTYWILPILFLFLYFYTYRNMQPIKFFFEPVNSATVGKYEHILDSKTNAVIGRLATDFNKVIDNIRNQKKTILNMDCLVKEQQLILSQLLDQSHNLIFIRNRHGEFTLVNKAFADAHHDTIENIQNLTVFDLYDVKTAWEYFDSDKTVMNQQQEQIFSDCLMLDKDGKRRWFQLSKIPIVSSDGECELVLGVSTEITDKVLKEQAIEYHANHDFLTKLPNRMYFQKQMDLDMNSVEIKTASLLFLDLDGFKTINDSLGHAVGDELIREVAELLKRNILRPAVLSRMGGDEFAIWMPHATLFQAVDLAQKILAILERPIVLATHELHVTASIGISFFPEDGVNVKTLLSHADNAMYGAKSKGKNTYEIFTPEMSVKSQERLEIESLLRKALDKNELYLVYQPKLDIKQDKITGVEALLRWNNPKLGNVPPDKFIPIAEESGLIIPIGKWVLQEACKQNKYWQKAKGLYVQMAVNLSTKQFQYDGLLFDINQILRETELKPKWLELEITESIIMENLEIVMSVLDEIKNMGITLSIDDFGTGYSSLSYLKKLPVETLKIDKSFINDITVKDEDRAITKAIIAMGKSLNMTVIAEGVETNEQMEFLAEHGCHQAQGYLIGRPLNMENIEVLLHDNLVEL
ncbi:EAL domain-containing protein [Bacillus sp. ISL-18]|uniref:sensor domain-containing protein n=1 Tax=Bacillus sp. ISL-18 TaxID=2819118 RepID=UPI001BE9F3BB|nr:EAL domain-containing protein [Bacillus sp. ISL-18]MBT2657820.1 EAL domain-containing protein [Bacillus sp. ISL-18]